MATITEDYVSFEIAKLLKEKGFNEKLFSFYITDKAKKEGCFQLMAFTDDEIDNNHSDHCYLAPTLQMTMKWLRETKNIFIDVYYDCDFGEGYKFSVHKLPKGTTLESHNENYSTYEQACKAAIKYCLENLI